MDINTVNFMGFLGIASTIVATILAYKFIVPENKRAKLNKLGQFLSDVFNFKFLIVEKILQFFYILSTIACVCVGVCMIFGITVYESSWSGEVYTDWYGLYGIALALLGPIAVRISFETLMMFILLVKNVIQINKKLKGADDNIEYQMPSFKDLVNKENFDFVKNMNNKAQNQAPVYTPDPNQTDVNNQQ